MSNASAAEIITFVGVPLAVLGVTPILYTFISALYTRSHLLHLLHQSNLFHLLHKSDLDAHVRARLMTGVVEVDLPVFQLEPLPRDDPLYWAIRVPSLSVKGTSWSHFNWFIREADRVCVRFQRSDKLVLPESMVDFEKLLAFLLDRGASLSPKGFHALRHRGQQAPVGTVLMEIRTDSEGDTIPVLTVTKPGERHGSISLELYWREGLHHRNSASLPLSWIRGPAVRMQRIPAVDPVPVPESSSASRDTSQGGSSALELASAASILQHHFYIQIGASGVEGIFDSDSNYIDSQANLEPDHLNLLKIADGHWESWFACATVATFGYKHGTIFRYKPRSKVLYLAREGEIPARAAFHLNLIGRLDKNGEGSLPGLYSDENIQPIDEFGQRILSRLQEHAERPPKDRIRPKELLKISQWSTTKTKGVRRSPTILKLTEPDRLPELMAKYVCMPELLKLCLLFLSYHTVNVQSGPIMPLRSKNFELDQFSQEAAEAIIYAMIADHKFAQIIYSELDSCMTLFLGRRDKVWDQSISILERSEMEKSGYFCCAIVLLAIVGKRAAYLLSGEDVEVCENEWRTVYLS